MHRFPASERSRKFLRDFYPDATLADWNNWKWQVRNRIRSVEQLSRIVQLTDDERNRCVETIRERHPWNR